jgi:uncharacterized protein YciI
MYIILIHHRQSDTSINFHKERHKQFIKKQIEEGNFITAGNRNPKTGEVILSSFNDLETLQMILYQDPYYRNRIGQYEIIEFTPEDISCKPMQELIEKHENNL